MPVSSPSYFPPARGTDQIIGLTAGQGQTGARAFMAGQGSGKFTRQSDLILIGDNVMSSGTLSVPNTDVGGNGTTIIGSQAGSALNTFSGPVTAPVILLGSQAAQKATNIPGSIIIGTQALSNMDNSGTGSIRTLILIGHQVMQNAQDQSGVPMSSSVIIGYQAMKGSGLGKTSILDTVVIGSSALTSYPAGSGGSIGQSVFIGANVCPSISNCNVNVVIGAGSGASAGASSGNVILGAVNNFQNNTNCIMLGGGNTLVGTLDSIMLLGVGCGTPTGNRAICIGAGSGKLTALAADQAILETYDGVTRRTAFFSDMTSGNIVIGNGARTLVVTPNNATNCLFLPNGTKSTSSPVVGGGYFYVDPATGLHFVGSSGTDTTVAPV